MAKIYDAVLRLTTSPFVQSLERAEKQLDRFQEHYRDMGRDFKRISKNFELVGKSLSTFVTAPIVGMGVASAKAYIQFEDAFSGVKKTVNASEQELNQLKKALIAMSEEIPPSAVELAQIAESAGQLGIKTENIEKFTRTIADLNVATNLGDEVASQLAQFANITKMSQKDFDRLGSTIVALGNNFATTEQDIVNMAMRIGSAGTQVGMAQHEILALSTAISSVGIEAEAGGTAFSKLLSDMALAVETGNDKMKDYANVLGYTAEGFRELFRSDPTTALSTFISALAHAKENGKSAIVILDELGLSDVRMRNALLSAANANDMFTDSLTLGAKAWEENTALSKEAEQKYKTLASQIKILRNTIFNLGAEIGEYLSPYVQKAIDDIKDLTKKFKSLDEHTKQNIVKFALVAAAIGPVMLVMAKVAMSIAKVYFWFSNLSRAAKAAGGLFQLINTPANLFMLKLLLVVAVVILIIKYWDVLKAKAEELFPGIGEKVSHLIDLIKELGKFAVEEIQNMIREFYSVGEKLLPFLEPIIQGAINIFSNLFHGIVGILSGLIDFVLGVFTKDWQRAFEGFSQVVEGFLDMVNSILGNVLNTMIGFINTVISAINKIKIPDWVPGIGGTSPNIPTIPEIPMLASGTSSWIGGIAQVHERGGELIDLPRGSRVIPHDKSLEEAFFQGKKSVGGQAVYQTISIPKLADEVHFNSEQDMDLFLEKLYKKLKIAELNRIGG